MPKTNFQKPRKSRKQKQQPTEILQKALGIVSTRSSTGSTWHASQVLVNRFDGGFCRPDGRLKTRPKRRFVPKKKDAIRRKSQEKCLFFSEYMSNGGFFCSNTYPFFFWQNGFVPQGSTREVLVLGNPGVKAELIHSGRMI